MITDYLTSYDFSADYNMSRVATRYSLTILASNGDVTPHDFAPQKHVGREADSRDI